MSWFDKLFGEDNDSNDDLIHRKKKRRQESQNIDNDHDSLLPQNNDIYSRPRGKFRFPMSVAYENENVEQSADTISDEKEQYHRDYRKQSHDSRSQKRHRRRRNQTTEEQNYSEQRGNSKISQQSIKYKDHSHYHTNKPGTYVSAINGIEKKTHKSKTHNMYSNNTNHRAKDSTPDYHKESFKTSEVPSAIFGTMKPKKLENGRIPVSKPSEKVESDKQKYDKYVAKTQTSQNKQLEQEKQNDSVVKQGTASKSSDENVSSTTKSMPNYSKVDNTIKIENIYASQIVEEIRRERERKVLQKRRFKKALQQKREEHKNEEQDAIQRAIDEMYAKQAERYVGDSSLNDDSDLIDNSTDASQLHTNGIENETVSNDENKQASIQNEDTNDTHVDESPYNYEEVSLNQVSTTKQLSDDEVTVSNVTSQHQSALQHNVEVNDKDELKNQSRLIADSEEDGATNKEEYSGSQIDDAEFYELNDTEADEDTTSNIEDNTNRNASEMHVDAPKTQEHAVTESQVNNIDKTVDNEIELATRHKKDDQTNLSVNSLKTNDVNDGHVVEDSSMNEIEKHNAEITENVQNEAAESEQNVEEKTIENVNPKKQTEKVSTLSKRPFNVVMTPSDKKRMMDRKKHSKVNVSELKPVQSKQAVSESKPASQAAPSSSSDSQESNTNAYKTNNMTSNNVENNQLIGHAETENDYQNAQQYSEQKPSADSTQTEIFEESQDDNQLENEQVDQSTSSSVSEVSDITEESEETTHPNNTSGQQDNDDQQKDLQPSFSNQNEDTANENRPRTNQQDVATNQAVQTSKPMIRKGPNIKLPSVSLLEEPQVIEPDEDWITDKKKELNDALFYFNVPAEVQDVTEGPSVTRFELSVEKGVKVSRITALQDDIKMALAAKDIRIEAPIPGTSRVGIEVPNQNPTTVNLRSIIESPSFKNAESKLTVAMGYRINNEPLLMDIAKTPHALIAGATGSGKSVCINSILMSLLYKNHPEELRLLLIDPKMVELAPYNGLPHLVAPVITDVKAATQSLKWAVEEMERRYKLFAHYHVRNITAFNKKAPYDERMPKIVIVIDELADLMMMAPQEVEQSIARIAQKARACGIHMLVATQRPSVNVITGLIKANIPTRIAFMVSSSVDSRTILDSGGAERLLGYGDMLYLGSGMNKPIRVQGTFVSDDEIDDVVDFIKQQREPDYLFEEKELLKKTQTQSQDELFDDVCAFMVNEGHISTSLIQRHFQIGYNRAARIIDQLEQLGYVSSANGSKPRDVYVTEADLNKE
ncbi:TPA: DNA translocase FtsK [Staphylococcus aureus]|uniref:DNA translocase FtsK n=1 Tax=Staphylococcus aureus TaxID=1280 RepID=UPI00076977B7|nr:DNA translocase FtsK [Staphylococcus aureus]CXT34971.1 SpoIIIE family cell division protein [Staphylococcus aureus]CYA10373.1 SpoIIIE family cell division protein [Staphylococcus aureus]HDB6933011.1 DNA translocase FtsK [Staphylococcus aureus]HDB7787067.1 DNA translocase FtsK [Staphylococcus aureus]HDD4401479.1 DNA translocase FtsK [Staphylococcus aureus]